MVGWVSAKRAPSKQHLSLYFFKWLRTAMFRWKLRMLVKSFRDELTHCAIYIFKIRQLKIYQGLDFMTRPGIAIQYDKKVSGISRITQSRSVRHLVFKRFSSRKITHNNHDQKIVARNSQKYAPNMLQIKIPRL